MYVYAREAYCVCASAALQDPPTVYRYYIKYNKSLIYRGNPVSIYYPDFIPRYSDIMLKRYCASSETGLFKTKTHVFKCVLLTGDEPALFLYSSNIIT